MSFVNIRTASGTEKLTDHELTFMMSFLPESRIKKAYSYIKPSDMKNCIAVYFLLFYSFYKERNSRDMPAVVCADTGKPYFDNEKSLFFSLSHCRGAVCCGLSSSEIGIDIQDRITHLDSVMDFAMSSNEKKLISLSPDPYMYCSGLWSLKEAFLKYTGKGLTEKMKMYDFSDCLWKKKKKKKLHFLSLCDNEYSAGICSECQVCSYESRNIREYISEFRNWL